MNLKVNRNKSKVMDLSKGMRPMNLKFKMNGIRNSKWIDIFGYNVAMHRSVKNHKINLVEKVLQVSVNCQLDLFDKISIPMLTYGSEIWRCENIDILEKNTLNILWAIA